MDPWLLREIDDLQSKIDRMVSPRELTQEIKSIREEANRIAGASFLGGPFPPLFVSLVSLRSQVDRLQEKINSHGGE